MRYNISLVPVIRTFITFRSKIFRKSILDNWEKHGRPVPPPHELKQIVIEQYNNQYACNILVETGTYMGNMVEIQRKNFKRIYSIELSTVLWKMAVNRFEKYDHITILQGDSGKVLNQITKDLTEQAIFWLDGHYSAGITAKGDLDCPIFKEIDAIFEYKNCNHIILVDDAMYFNGQGDYPTIEDLTKYIKKYDERYSLEVKDDIIRYTVN